MGKKSKKKRNEGRVRSPFENMIVSCPICKARSYPRILKDPQNAEEQEAVFCGSCKANLRPFIDHWQREEAKQKALEAIAEHQQSLGSASPSPQILADLTQVTLS